MTRSKVLLIICFPFALSIISFAQPETACAYKLDHFGRINDHELDKRVRDLFDHLKTTTGATAYVIAYAGADALPTDRERVPMFDRIRQLVTYRGYDDSRFVMISGGFRETQAAEFFIVPDDAPPPEPSFTVAQPEIPNGTVLWAKKTFSSDSDEGILEDFVNRAVLYRLDAENTDGESESTEYNGPAYIEEDDYVSIGDTPDESENSDTEIDNTPSEYNGRDQEYLESDDLQDARFAWADKRFADAILMREESRGVMFFYADDNYYDIARLQPFIEHARDQMASTAGLDPAQIEVTYGGYRPRVEIEYYLVPKGGKSPEPTPTTAELVLQ